MSESKSMYAITGRIKDVNTLLVQRQELEAITQAARQALEALLFWRHIAGAGEIAEKKADAAIDDLVEAMDPGKKASKPPEVGHVHQVPAEWLEHAFREGWEMCRDAEYVGEEAEDWGFANSATNSRMIDAQQAGPQPPAVNKKPIGLALIRREDGEVVAFYPMDMAPELAGLNERFELVMAYRGPLLGHRPLTDEQIDAIGDALPGGIQGFLKLWGWRQFARAVERALRIEGGAA